MDGDYPFAEFLDSLQASHGRIEFGEWLEPLLAYEYLRGNFDGLRRLLAFPGVEIALPRGGITEYFAQHPIPETPGGRNGVQSFEWSRKEQMDLMLG